MAYKEAISLKDIRDSWKNGKPLRMGKRLTEEQKRLASKFDGYDPIIIAGEFKN